MATANELFAANGEDYIVIDSDLRTMTFPLSVKNIGVENDKDVHKLNFMMPRYFSEYDLSTFNIRINYLNAQGDGDTYIVTDPTVEDDAIYFSWLVGRHACLYRGAVTFIVCLKLADGEGDVAQEFNTTLASLQVLPGLETEPAILETDYDIIEQLLLTIQDTNDKIKAVLDSGMTAEELGNIAKEQKTLKSRMDEFASLPDGSTTGDAELIDIRVGADGATYASAGEAVRTQVADLKSDLSQTQAEISGMSISGFVRKYVNAETTVVTGAYVDVNGNPVSVASWSYCYLDVKEGETYKVTGVAATGGRLYVLKDANGAVIDKYQSETNVVYVDLEYTIPENGAVLYVNTLIPRIAVPAVKKISYHFVNNNTVGSVTVKNNSGSEYTITAGGFSHVVDLYGSANGTFTFKDLNLSGSTFKPVNDDITPINLETVGYVGANHGYIWVYSCTISGHGLTVADIGKTSTDGTNTWILLQVTDANTVVVGCYDASAWFRLKRVAPTALNFGENDLTVSNATLAQLYPSVKDVTVVIDDSDSGKCVVSEQYDIINVGSGIEAIKTNVGSNTNQSIATLADSIARVCNVYEFQANGAVVIYSSTKILKTDIITNFVSFIQSGAFTTKDSIWIPETTKYGGVTPETGTQIDFVRTGWIDQTKPPQEYIQLNGNATNTTKAMILGYIINDGRSESISDTAGFISAAGKMYPHFVQPKSELSEVTDFNTISYRIPVAVNDFTNIPGFGFSCGYVVIGKDIYLFINTILSNRYVDFPVPSFMQGKKIEVIMSKNMECQSRVTTRIVSLKYTTRGSVILRLYD